MADMLLELCRWPELGEPYAEALRQAVAFVLDEADPVGIVATGTVIRGEAHPASDIDLYVLHDAPYRRRVQRFFAGVPTEIFINPPHVVRSYFRDEHRTGRRFTAHMLATGFVILDRGAVVEALRSESRDWLARPHEWSSEDAQRARYAAATRLEDGADTTQTDAAVAALLLAQSVTEMLEYWLRAHGRPLPRAKALVSEITALDPELGAMTSRFALARSPLERLEAAHQIADYVLQVRGFFEWDSGRDPIPDA
jgi:predicted nucleotidyltransferase